MRHALPLLLLIVPACHSDGGGSKSFAATVQDKVRDTLRDPESATFRIISSSAKENVLCGQVNAKNGFGGYTGFEYFVFDNGIVRHSTDAGFSASFKKCTDVGIADAKARAAEIHNRK